MDEGGLGRHSPILTNCHLACPRGLKIYVIELHCRGETNMHGVHFEMVPSTGVGFPATLSRLF